MHIFSTILLVLSLQFPGFEKLLCSIVSVKKIRIWTNDNKVLKKRNKNFSGQIKNFIFFFLLKNNERTNQALYGRVN
jgi:hypothetical protein